MIVSADDVFMPNELERDEYVMADNGKVYKGCEDDITFVNWGFDQVDAILS